MADNPLTVKTTVEVTLTVAQIAEVFAGLSSDQQAEFFLKVSEETLLWSAHARMQQWTEVGRHVRDSGNYDAGQMLSDLFDGWEP